MNLKACPFCGADWKTGLAIGYKGQPATSWHVACTNCLSEGPDSGYMEGPESATEKWNKRGDVSLPSPEPEPHSYALLKLEGATKPLYFIMEERYGNREEADYDGHRQYFYEEHSCPTGWLDNCVAVIEDGDTDPHGFLTFVRSVKINPESAKDQNEEEIWQEIFPEAFPSPSNSAR